MTLPTDGEIAVLTVAAEATLNDTCTIRDPGTRSRTQSGGWTNTNPVTYTNVPCRRTHPASMNGRSTVAGTQLAVMSDYTFAVKKTQPLAAGWTVTMGGATFTVKEVLRTNSIPVLKKAFLVAQETVGI